METCPRCNHFRLYPCRCVRFECAEPWYPLRTLGPKIAACDWVEVYAIDAEAAAEEYAEQSDSGNEYRMLRNGEGVVHVRDSEGKETVFEITAESVPSYNAQQRTGPLYTALHYVGIGPLPDCDLCKFPAASHIPANIGLCPRNKP